MIKCRWETEYIPDPFQIFVFKSPHCRGPSTELGRTAICSMLSYAMHCVMGRMRGEGNMCVILRTHSVRRMRVKEPEFRMLFASLLCALP